LLLIIKYIKINLKEHLNYSKIMTAKIPGLTNTIFLGGNEYRVVPRASDPSIPLTDDELSQITALAMRYIGEYAHDNPLLTKNELFQFSKLELKDEGANFQFNNGPQASIATDLLLADPVVKQIFTEAPFASYIQVLRDLRNPNPTTADIWHNLVGSSVVSSSSATKSEKEEDEVNGQPSKPAESIMLSIIEKMEGDKMKLSPEERQVLRDLMAHR
jgi:hypothetical protein